MLQPYRLYRATPPLRYTQVMPIKAPAAREVREVQAVQEVIPVRELQAEPMQVQKPQVQVTVRNLLPTRVAQARDYRQGKPADLRRAKNKEA